jgi:hypothetical protein
MPAHEPQESGALAPEPKAETPKKGRRQKKTEGEKKTSALDAAAKVLTETGQAMTCQEMIKLMAEKGYWEFARGQDACSDSLFRHTQGDQGERCPLSKDRTRQV